MRFLLLDCRLFAGTADLRFLYDCIKPKIKRCTDGERVSLGGNVGLVLNKKIEFEGREYGKDEIFGEVYAMLSINSPEFIAPKACDVMLISAAAFHRTCSEQCEDHAKMIDNFNRKIVERLDSERVKSTLLSVHGIQSRYLAYLRHLHARQGTNPVEIDLGITDIARYLNLSRPSLSREVKALEKNGVIKIDGCFVYLNDI